MHYITRRSMLAAATVMILAGCTSTPPADFNWNGVWSGSSGNRTTEIAISGDRVTYWRSNGASQEIASFSVGAASVTIKHAGGATVVLRPRGDGKVAYSWRGRGASSSAVLSKS